MQRALRRTGATTRKALVVPRSQANASIGVILHTATRFTTTVGNKGHTGGRGEPLQRGYSQPGTWKTDTVEIDEEETPAEVDMSRPPEELDEDDVDYVERDIDESEGSERTTTIGMTPAEEAALEREMAERGAKQSPPAEPPKAPYAATGDRPATYGDDVGTAADEGSEGEATMDDVLMHHHQTTRKKGALLSRLKEVPETEIVGGEPPAKDHIVPDDDEEDDNIVRHGPEKKIARRAVRFLSPEENVAVRLQKIAYKYAQEGPYIGSNMKDKETHAIALRSRRDIERVPPIGEKWQGYETSFRRLPEGIKLPNELVLRNLYPMATTLSVEWKEANCVDGSTGDIDEDDPHGIEYGFLTPKNYDPSRTYPTMVCVPDHRGTQRDFEDMCRHMWERPGFAEALEEQQWVIFCPMIAMRHSILYPNEAVIARFCDWVTENFNVEHGKVHLVGKGLGGYAALRTVLEHRHLAISATGILGRLASPYRPLERPFDKVRQANGTHTLLIVPGGMRKQEYVYKFKNIMDAAHVRPPCRVLHYADVRDHQIYYAINPVEFMNYMLFFRQHNLHAITTTESGHTWRQEGAYNAEAAGFGNEASKTYANAMVH